MAVVIVFVMTLTPSPTPTAPPPAATPIARASIVEVSLAERITAPSVSTAELASMTDCMVLVMTFAESDKAPATPPTATLPLNPMTCASDCATIRTPTSGIVTVTSSSSRKL